MAAFDFEGDADEADDETVRSGSCVFDGGRWSSDRADHFCHTK